MPSPVPEGTPDTTADDFLLEALTPLEFDDLSLQPASHTEVLTDPINVTIMLLCQSPTLSKSLFVTVVVLLLRCSLFDFSLLVL